MLSKNIERDYANISPKSYESVIGFQYNKDLKHTARLVIAYIEDNNKVLQWPDQSQ